MQLNDVKIRELLKERFNGRYTNFANAIDVDLSHLHKVINHNVGLGQTIIGGIMKYCVNNNLNPLDYFVL